MQSAQLERGRSQLAGQLRGELWFGERASIFEQGADLERRLLEPKQRIPGRSIKTGQTACNDYDPASSRQPMGPCHGGSFAFSPVRPQQHG